MDNKKTPEPIPDNVSAIPFVAYEMAERRHDRREKIHWIMHFVMLFALALTVVAFVWLWNQYDTVSSTEASGVYAQIVDKSVVANGSDIPSEQLPGIIKSLEDAYGKSEDSQKAG